MATNNHNKIINLLPAIFYIILGFTGVEIFSSHKASATLIVVQSNPYRQLIYSLLYVWSAIILINNREKLNKTLRYWTIPVIFIIYALLSSLWSAFPVKTLKDVAHLFGALLIVAVFVSEIEKDKRLFINTIFYTTTIIVIASIITLFIYPDFAYFYMGKLRWQGITQHPNYLGLASMLCVLSSSWLILHNKNIPRRLLCAVIIILSFITLIGSNSKTALLMTLLLLFLSIFFKPANKIKYSYSNYISNPPFVIKIFMILLFILPVLCVLFIFWPALFEIDYIFGLVDRKPDLTGRVFMWDLGWTAFLKKPLLGWGYDGLLTVKKTHLGSTLPYFQFHNGYLNLLVLSGTIGGLIFLIMFVKTIKALWNIRHKNKDMCVFMSILFVSILIHNISESSIFQPTSVLSFLFLCIYFLSENMKSNLNNVPQDLV